MPHGLRSIETPCGRRRNQRKGRPRSPMAGLIHAPFNRIVVPRSLRGLTSSVAFQREDGNLVILDFEV